MVEYRTSVILCIILLVAIAVVPVCSKRSQNRGPTEALWDATRRKIRSFLRSHDMKPTSQTALAIYHVGYPSPEDSIDLLVNNVKLFATAVRQHVNHENSSAYYIFNIAGGEKNPLMEFLPSPFSAHVSHLERGMRAYYDLDTHMDTVISLNARDDSILLSFQSILFLNHEARGPFYGRQNGDWWRSYTQIFESNPTVAAVAPSVTCETSAHLEFYALAIRSRLVNHTFEQLRMTDKYAGWRKKSAEIALSSGLIANGHQIASILHNATTSSPQFQGNCITHYGNTMRYQSLPSRWCDLDPSQMLFVHWGGEPFRKRGHFCEDAADLMTKLLLQFAKSEPEMQPVLPETTMGGSFYDLQSEYNREMWRDRSIRLVKRLPIPDRAAKVCFMVRTFVLNTPDASTYASVNGDLDMLIRSLLRQTSMHWEAFFFVTDDQPFEELPAFVKGYGDARLKIIPIDEEHLFTFSMTGAGSVATDYALEKIRDEQQCKWICITNGDNMYGSTVVQGVLNAAPNKGSLKLPEMIAVPLDTRIFPDIDYKCKRSLDGKVHSWDEHCTEFDIKFLSRKYAYARPVFPTIAGIDLAAMFMNRQEFFKTKIKMADFIRANGDGLQDGVLADHLLHKIKWDWKRLPLRGLSSVAFHGPSPLLCVASGNIWFDHPDVDKVGCLTHKDIGSMYPLTRFDWVRYFSTQSKKVCLRLSEQGYSSENATTNKRITC